VTSCSGYLVQDWRELNGSLFTALMLQKIALLIALMLIVAVAAFNMVAALTMMVIDKTRDIAIMKSMGATSAGVARTFQVMGLMIGGAGTVAGVAIGSVTCALLARLDHRLDPATYSIDRLPVAVRPAELAAVAVLTMFVSALATLAPASQASSLPPVDGLRAD
jgi:lipoprotein-releasing system permease protein